ncbi:MAG: ATP-binding protein, partial [Hydrogenophaga sp.]
SLLIKDPSLNLPPPAQRYLAFVGAGGQRMKSLLDDLLGFLEVDSHTLQKQRVDITAVAAEVRDDLALALEHSQGQIEFGHLPAAYGDASLLRIALQNLTANALKFVAPGTRPVVKISAGIEESTLHIRVQDNGIGIEEGQLTKVFEMFKRLHSSKAYSGTGLGLSICRRIAELHGGQVSVTSQLGMGSCFTLSLPTTTQERQVRSEHEFL